MKNLFGKSNDKNTDPNKEQPESVELDEQDLEQVTGASGGWNPGDDDGDWDYSHDDDWNYRHHRHHHHRHHHHS